MSWRGSDQLWLGLGVGGVGWRGLRSRFLRSWKRPDGSGGSDVQMVQVFQRVVQAAQSELNLLADQEG